MLVAIAITLALYALTHGALVVQDVRRGRRDNATRIHACIATWSAACAVYLVVAAL